MDWELWLMLVLSVLAMVFFALALFYRTKPRVLKFTSYGLITLVILGTFTLRFQESDDLKIAVLVFIVLAAAYHWFYRGALLDGDKD